MTVFQKFTISGFKSIANGEVEFGQRNVVIGANGSGKSNLIGAFTLLQKVITKNLQLYVGGEPDRLLHHGRKVSPSCLLKIELLDVSLELVLSVNNNALIIEKEVIYYAGGSIRNRFPGNSESYIADLEKSPISAQVCDGIRNINMYHFHDVSNSSPARQTCDVNDNRILRKDAANLPAFLYMLNKTYPVHFRRVEEHIQLVMPLFKGFKLAPMEIYPNRIKLEWEQKGSDAYFDAFSLSDGTLRFICLATLLLQPSPPSLIVLDEPELGLHPSAIHILAEMIHSASLKTQIILATQSVTLLNHFAVEDVIVTENEGGATTFRRLSGEEYQEWLQDYSLGELWEKNVLGGRP